MTRTDASTVLETFDADAGNAEVEQWIDMASDLVDDVEDNASLPDDRLKNIETLVAQHFLAAQYPRFSSQSGAARSAEYAEGRSKTAYLDRAIRLDPTGTVRNSLSNEDVIYSA